MEFAAPQDAGRTPGQGRRFRPFFVAVCEEARLRRGASQERVADLAGVKAKTIDRFEKGETWPRENLEAFTAAYAEIDDLADPRMLFERAIEWWYEHGHPPLPKMPPLSKRDMTSEIRHIGEICQRTRAST